MGRAKPSFQQPSPPQIRRELWMISTSAMPKSLRLSLLILILKGCSKSKETFTAMILRPIVVQYFFPHGDLSEGDEEQDGSFG